MRRLSHIIVAFTTLIITLFGSSGVGLMTCACSGETTLVVPMDDGCCGADRSCMTVRVVQISDGGAVATLHASADLPLPAFAALPSLVFSDQYSVPGAPLALSTQRSVFSSPPPPGRLSMVMRV